MGESREGEKRNVEETEKLKYIDRTKDQQLLQMEREN